MNKMERYEKIQIGIVLAFVICLLIMVYWMLLPISNYKPNLKQINDSLVDILKQKDSVLNLKETLYNDKKATDSIQLNSINNSIKNLRYEIKQQSKTIYSMSDSVFMRYVDSIRSNNGFNKIQYNGK